MIKEFEGRTEKEAIDVAIEELGLDREEFDVEIVESEKKGFLFRKGNVRIRIHVFEEEEEEIEDASLSADTDFERELVRFLEGCIERMGFPGKAYINGRENNKLRVSIDSDFSRILIGRKGKNLDALQLLTNVFAGKKSNKIKVIVDTEQYRERKEENLVRLAYKVAEQVRRDRQSKLLEPMNPFERRLIHTSLNGMKDIATKSEGDGLYKQVRIYYRGTKR